MKHAKATVALILGMSLLPLGAMAQDTDTSETKRPPRGEKMHGDEAKRPPHGEKMQGEDGKRPPEPPKDGKRPPRGEKMQGEDGKRPPREGKRPETE